VIEAVMLWNEPNNNSHWDSSLDPDWSIFARTVRLAADAIASENPSLPKVLGGISPISAEYIERMKRFGVLDKLDVVAVHGFPIDWNHWPINEWPLRLNEIRAVTDLPVWVTEVGVSTFGADEVQEFGLRRTADLLTGRVDRVHWYSLFDLPRTWPAAGNPELEGSAYYRHFYMGLIREDGTPKPAFYLFHEFAPRMGVCQWVHYEDPRLDDMVRRLREMGVKYLRTGLSWADSLRPNALEWFDRQMRALDGFDVTVTFCFTPEHRGIAPHHTSPPQVPEEFAEFCAQMVRRYAPGTTAQSLPRNPGVSGTELSADGSKMERRSRPSSDGAGGV
jgi:beta-xylosidase